MSFKTISPSCPQALQKAFASLDCMLIKEYGIILCSCSPGLGLPLDSLQKHLKHTHHLDNKYTAAHINHIRNYFNTHQRQPFIWNAENARKILPKISGGWPLPGILIYHDGALCAFEGCGHIIAAGRLQERMKKHWKDDHADFEYMPYTDASYQKIFSMAKSYVHVQCIKLQPSATKEDLFQAQFGPLLENQPLPPDAIEEGRIHPHGKEVLQKLGFYQLLEKHDKSSLKELITLPAKGTFYFPLFQAVQEILKFDPSYNGLLEIREAICKWRNKPGVLFNILYRRATLQEYGVTAVRLLTFVLKSFHSGQFRACVDDTSRDVEVEQGWDVSESGEETSFQFEEIEEDLFEDDGDGDGGESTPFLGEISEDYLESEDDSVNDDAEYIFDPNPIADHSPGKKGKLIIDLSSKQLAACKEVHGILGLLMNAQQSGTLMVKLVESTLNLILSIFTKQPKDVHKGVEKNCIEPFIALISFNFQKGVFKSCKQMTPALSRLMYLNQYSILKKVVQAPNPLDELKKYSIWLTKSHQCPTSLLTKTNGLLTNMSKTEPSPATMEWESRSSSKFIIHSEVSGSNGADVVDIIEVLHSLYKEAHRLLYSEILENLSPQELGFKETDDIFLIASKDQAMFNTKGYGLPTGAFKHLEDGLMVALLKSEKAQEVASVIDGGLFFNTATLSKKLDKIERFLESLFPVAHILGLPKRGTELECCQVLNSEQRPRNVKAYFSQIIIGGGYNKTSGITGKDSKTLHMFPQSVEELLLTYLALVHPFQARVVPLVVKSFDHDFSDFLWASKGKKWTATRFTRILRDKTREISSNGTGFGLHDIRHISAGINDHYDLKQPEPSDSADHVADLSSGHKTATAEGAYAITPQQDQRYSQAFVYNCQDFFKKLHYLFGFDGNSLQLRSEQDLWTISRGKEIEVQSLLLLQNIQAELKVLKQQQDTLSESLDQMVLSHMQMLQSKQGDTVEVKLQSTPFKPTQVTPLLIGDRYRGDPENESPNLTPTKLQSGFHTKSLHAGGSPGPTMTTPTKHSSAKQTPESISMATPSPRALALKAGKEITVDFGSVHSECHPAVTNLSSIVKADRREFSKSSLFQAEVEIIQSALQNKSFSLLGKTVMQRLHYALKSVPKMSRSHAVCCECSATFSGANSQELLYKHFLRKDTDKEHKVAHKLSLSFKLPVEGRGKSAKYYRMDKHGNFGFICEAYGCAKYLPNAAAVKNHIQELSTQEIKDHSRFKYLEYAKKNGPYHHLGTSRLEFEVEDE
ncbi:hypothetical protein SCHPADRAFT_939318 [Schizopora paradoxa]|uniref:Uncharacterized protein n=1 Tax=Schizopora paradoxa TaxID=27342 RepID=A0A0H2RZ23_9AGAM|nr:hypothetical protein SCHPADRAFT_939318 [Schizopora paradoxa]